MVKATPSDKAFIVDILVDSFYDNASVNYIIKQDKKKSSRIKGLMNYSFDLCYHFGEIYYSEDLKGCALLLFPERKTKNFTSFMLDLKFILSSLDLKHLKRAMSRESKVKARRESGQHCYLWFIGVDPKEQGKGTGTKLLKEVIGVAQNMKRPILLETSNIDNVRWYKKAGFTIYDKLDLSYLLYFMKYE